MTKVILFDIDGTLVLTGGAGERAMARAFEELFSVPRRLPATSRCPAGRTPWILSDAAAAHGIPADSPPTRRVSVTVYLAHLRRRASAAGPAQGRHARRASLLDALAGRDDVYLALLTETTKGGARRSSSTSICGGTSACGAFGDDAPDRNRLLPKALARIRGVRRTCGRTR